jgi:SAM-dependent methyltransferase
MMSHAHREYMQGIVDRRVQFCKDRAEKIIIKWGRRLDTPMPVGLKEDRDFLVQYAKGDGVDVCCGDFLIEDSVGVDTRRTVLGADFHFSADTLSFRKPESCDYVVSNYLEAVPNTIGALNEWYRVLKSGGTLAMICRDAEQYVQPEGALASGHRQHTFNKTTLRHYMYRAGFKDVHITPTLWQSLQAVGIKP